MRKLRNSSILFGAFVLASAGLWAAGYEFEGVGARHVSRGGAAIADADDWTAIYWNPANLAKKRTGEFGVEIFSGEAFGHDPNSLSALVGPIFPKHDLHSNFILGALGALVPVGERGAIGFGFYTPLLQGAQFKSVGTNANRTTIDLDNSAAILTWNISGAYKITDRFSAGAGVNLLYGRFMSDIRMTNYLFAGDSVVNKVDGDGVALEGMLGFRVEATKTVSLGAVYRSGSDIDIEGDGSSDYATTVPFPFTQNDRSKFHYDLRHPSTWGVGVAVRPNTRWTLTTDYDRTLWHRFVSNIRYDNQTQFLPNAANSFDWKDTYKIRLGSRFKCSDKNELIAGYSYEEPALDSGSVDFSTAIDVYMNRFSFGVAHAWSEKLETTLGLVAGYGERTIANQTYHLSGYQVMLETRFGAL
jgi:long-chain fatty acid transport protein